MSFHGNNVSKMRLEINKNVASRPAVQKKKAAKAFKAMVITILIGVTLIALSITGIILFNEFISHPDFIIKKVCVVDNQTIDPLTIVKISGIRTNMNIYATSLAPITERLEKHPDIKIAKVSKKHPDTIVIKVIEREPIAVIVNSKGHYDIPVDKDGIMLSENKMEYALHLPKITGLRNIAYHPGKKPDDPRVSVALEYLDTLKHIKKNTFINVRKINLEKPTDIVFQSASINKIIFTSEYSHDVILKLIRVINALRFQRINADKIDLRFANVAVTPCLL
ncbi:MAG: hypothetical protein DRI44_03410 [Chlamydiae bacterium]|nr:MAG: hypothetical protein DRI44_03410 [Chlamydiota bacterium]